MSPFARSVPAALAAAAAATALAIAVAIALPWLLAQSWMFASGDLVTALTVSVVAPLYLYTIVRIARAAVTERDMTPIPIRETAPRLR